MSAGVVFQEALRILNRQQFPEASRPDLLAVLEAALPGPLALLYDAGAEAGAATPHASRSCGSDLHQILHGESL